MTIYNSSDFGFSVEGQRPVAGQRHKKTWAEYKQECYDNGEVECIDTAHHSWVVSDEDENYCYCNKCGCCEY